MYLVASVGLSVSLSVHRSPLSWLNHVTYDLSQGQRAKSIFWHAAVDIISRYYHYYQYKVFVCVSRGCGRSAFNSKVQLEIEKASIGCTLENKYLPHASTRMVNTIHQSDSYIIDQVLYNKNQHACFKHLMSKSHYHPSWNEYCTLKVAH